MRHFLSTVLAIGLGLVLTGCSTKPQMNYAAANLVQVRGTVKLNGEPLPNAVVTFESPDDGTLSFAQTNSSGGYQLRFDSDAMGITPGKKLVRISTARKLAGLNGEEEGGGENKSAEPSERPQELIPDSYNQNSELFVDVSSSKTVFDFDLRSR